MGVETGDQDFWYSHWFPREVLRYREPDLFTSFLVFRYKAYPPQNLFSACFVDEAVFVHLSFVLTALASLLSLCESKMFS